MKKVVFLSIFLAFSAFSQDGVAPKVPYIELFQKKANEYSLPVSGLIAISQLTTNFDPEYSIPRRCGLMYVDATSSIFDNDSIDCFDPLTNIDIGAHWLNTLYHETKDIELAIQSYKYGYFAPSEYAPPKSQEQLEWERKVLELYKTYQLYYESDNEELAVNKENCSMSRQAIKEALPEKSEREKFFVACMQKAAAEKWKKHEQ